MTNRQGNMDPDRYQQRDIKRRLVKLERLAQATSNSLTRWKSRIRDLEADVSNLETVTGAVLEEPPIDAIKEQIKLVSNLDDLPFDDSQEEKE